MIAKSKFKTFFFWFSNICFVGGIFVLAYVAFEGFANEPLAGQIAITGAVMILLLIYGKMLWDAKSVTIDLDKQTILFTNRYTRKKIVYPVNYFDAYITTYQRTKVGDFRVVYLIKDNELLYKISRAVYSNQDELLASLPSLPDMGLIELSFIDRLRKRIEKKVLNKHRQLLT